MGWFLAATQMASGAGPAVRVGLIVEGEAAADVREGMRREVERTLPFDGVAWEWREARMMGVGESYDRVVVVRLRGACEWRGATTWSATDALGITHVVNGQVLPFVEADCARAAAAAGRLRGWTAAMGAREFGRGLGRIVAHELYHALTGRKDHDGEGLAKESLTAAELFVLPMEFSAGALDRMERALRGPELRTSARPPQPR